MDDFEGSLADALERAHQEIDDGIAAFAAAPGERGPSAREPTTAVARDWQAHPAIGAGSMLASSDRIWPLSAHARTRRISGQDDGIGECHHLLSGLAYLDPDECRFLRAGVPFDGARPGGGQ